MKKIYILHEYGDKSHFKALYDCAKEYGYNPTRQIILAKKKIYRNFKQDIKSGKIFSAFSNTVIDIFNHLAIWGLKDKILIVGIAPYDYLLNKYSCVFKKNTCYYFTSHPTWDGSKFPKGDINNKEKYESLLHECFQGCYCVSKVTESQVRRYIPNTSVVNHAIDFNAYKKEHAEISTKKRFVFIGTYTDRKNVKLILNWLINNPKLDLSFDFAGRGELAHEIDSAAKSDQRIHNLGYKCKAWIQENLSKYDYLVLPSKTEPFGIVLLEALASGTPCIVSNAEGPAEIIENDVTGFIFDLADENKGFDIAMNKSINTSKEDYLKMHKNAVEAGRQYDSTVIIKKWIQLL